MPTIKPLPEFPGYHISEFGELYRSRPDGALRAVKRRRFNRQQFRVYGLRRSGRHIYRRAIDLVANAFLCDSRGIVDSHKRERVAVWPANGDESDCSPGNLVVVRETDAIRFQHRQLTPARGPDPLIDARKIREFRRNYVESKHFQENVIMRGTERQK